LLHIFIEIRKGEKSAYFTREGYEEEVKSLLKYRSNDYPDWLLGYLYSTLSIYELQQKNNELFIANADTASVMLSNSREYCIIQWEANYFLEV